MAPTDLLSRTLRRVGMAFALEHSDDGPAARPRRQGGGARTAATGGGRDPRHPGRVCRPPRRAECSSPWPETYSPVRLRPPGYGRRLMWDRGDAGWGVAAVPAGMLDAPTRCPALGWEIIEPGVCNSAHEQSPGGRGALFSVAGDPLERRSGRSAESLSLGTLGGRPHQVFQPHWRPGPLPSRCWDQAVSSTARTGRVPDPFWDRHGRSGRVAARQPPASSGSPRRS
jgi:hypothetical protein